jgi:mannose-6-phosphate isomerase-like protein (cupin superfamily)
MTHTHYNEIHPYITKDGSEIRELMHPQQHGGQNQSLAEARVEPGCCTQLHRHHLSEELYYIQAGSGAMTLATETFAVKQGDTILIPPGTAHAIANSGRETLVILCCCSPAYHHEDTELLEQ